MTPPSFTATDRSAASRWLDDLHGDRLLVNRWGGAFSGGPGIPTPVVLGAGAAIVLVCLAILGLSLVLVRLESRQEESVLRTQGATAAVVARVHAWRAGLATVTAAVPAVVLSLLFLWIVGGTWRTPHPVSLLVLLVGMPLAAGLAFGAVGRRTPRRDTSVV